MANEDHVDRLLAQWARTAPRLDTRPVGVIARIGRVARYQDRGLAEVFAGHGLSRADFDVLASLRRVGPPYALSPSALSEAVMRTSGAMSQRLASLERAGLVERTLDPDDRRGIVVTLTPRGREVIDGLAPEHLANDRRMLAPLTSEEQATLAGLLKKLLLAYEAEAPLPAEPAAGRPPARRRARPERPG
jgi:DNA-binding MarR family transcriptional regulator